MKKLLPLCLLVILGGCATVDSWISSVNTTVEKYAPVVGRDLIMVANILVTAECSPAVTNGSAASVTSNVLNIVAPNSKAASTVQSVLAVNSQVANQLCPYVGAIKAQVGAVPQGVPSQVVTPGM